MLQPQLPANRRQYVRLTRYQLLVIAAAPLVGMAATAFLKKLERVELAGWVLFPLLAAGAMLIGLLELRKVMVFRRDLGERRSAEFRGWGGVAPRFERGEVDPDAEDAE